MDKKIEAAIRETLVIGNPVSIKRCVDKLKLIFEQEQALRQANVSGSLPQNVTVADIIDVLEKLIQNSHSIDADGEPTAPILDIVDAWIKARDLLFRLRQ